MARSMPCPQCGLVQLSHSQCKRCGAAVLPPPDTHRFSAEPRPAAVPNPYAPPSADLSRDAAESSADTLWRDGRILVMRPGAVLPDRCIKCNEPADGYRLQRVLYWHRPVWYWLILVSILIYAIVALIVRKRATVEVGLCPVHRQRRHLVLALGVLAIFGGLGGCLTFGQESDTAIYLGFLVALAGMVVAGVGHQVVSAAEIDDRYVRLKGAGVEFLSFLPDFQTLFH